MADVESLNGDTESGFEKWRRVATDEERLSFRKSVEPTFSGCFFVLIVLGLLNGVVAAFLTFSIALLAGPDAELWVKRLVPPVIGAVVLLVFWGIRSDRRRTRELVEVDDADGEITVVSAREVRWYYSLASRNRSSFTIRREFPILIGDLGDGQRIGLTGESMFRPELFGCDLDPAELVAGQSALNGLPEPFGFPTREFEIEFWPRSGSLVAIRPSGAAVDPTIIYVDSLHRVGWRGEAAFLFEGDPGLTTADDETAVELSSSAKRST